MSASVDVVVVGLGAVGSAALDHLARRGVRALGVDRFAPPHGLGSTHGETRVIRKAYFEHPAYVPLLARSYARWDELADRAGERLFVRCGVIQVGPPDGEIVPGVRRAAALHGLAVEALDADAIAARWPVRPAPGAIGAFEPDAGFLYVEACVRAHLASAARAGATIWTDVEVRGWRPDGDGVAIDTARGPVRAGALVIAGGPWAGALLADLDLPLRVLRKPVCWFADAPPGLAVERGGACWLVETAAGTYYGLPVVDRLGAKAAEHSGGDVVADPSRVERAPRAADEARLRGFLATHLPGVGGAVTRHDVCLYTMTPDAHPIVDRHPGHPRVALVAGLSGHGFKMTPALGEAAADLALDGASDLPIGFLGLDRAALR